MELNLTLKKARVLKGYRQIDLWARTGFQMSKISRIENGLIQPADQEKKKLAKALDKDEKELFPENLR
jgi:transcriptional regulator with XRE-family HTH domain